MCEILRRLFLDIKGVEEYVRCTACTDENGFDKPYDNLGPCVVCNGRGSMVNYKYRDLTPAEREKMALRNSDRIKRIREREEGDKTSN